MKGVVNTTKIALASGLVLCIAGANNAQAEWPERPITVVVQWKAGGGTDKNLRKIAEVIQKNTGWKINVINKAGGGGWEATRYVLGKKADGYTWLGASNFNKYLRPMGRTKTKAWEEWQYMQAGVSFGSWSVRPDSKFKSFSDVVKYAKANPGKLTLSTSGYCNLWCELGAIVADGAGIKVKYVGYKGGKPATMAGLNGEVMVAGGGVHEHIEFIKAGKLVNLQQTSRADIVLPDGKVLPSVGKLVPSIKSQLPLSGIYTPAVRRGTPNAIYEKIEKAFVQAVNSDAYSAMLKKKYFKRWVLLRKDADRRAALVESITAKTFSNLGIKGAVSPKELGLPDPKNFDKWWPPKGYKPKM